MQVFRRILTFSKSVKCLKNVHLSSNLYCYRNLKTVIAQPANKLCLPVKTFTVNFHTSRPNNALPPLFWMFIRPVLKVVGILFGRGIRKWWQKLPKNKKQQFLKSLIMRKNTVYGTCVAFGCVSCGYYIYHLEEHPITKRKRFILFTNDQIMQLTSLQIAMEMETHEHDVLPITHPAYNRVRKVITQLLNGNKDLPEVREKDWTITVIDSERIDAFVFLNGHIFVFTGILEMCKTDDQLGIILGHEMAHAILCHVGEKLSHAHIAEMLLIIPLVVLWSIFPDTAAFAFQLISNYLIKLVIQLPYDRNIEKEADEVGLQLAAKSCFDVRQASAFWQVMSEADPLNKDIEFLSTHPSHEHRKQFLEPLLPSALQLRKLCKCPDLL